MKTFFTSDLHFGHKRVIELCNRPYESISEMDADMTINWNRRVHNDDNVYVLGDFAFSDDHDSYLKRLRGRKHLIIGNHDSASALKKVTLWDSIQHYKELKLGDDFLVLSHYAFKVWNKCHKDAIQLYGHSHGNLQGDSQSCDVGVDCWDYKPVLLDEIKERLATQPQRYSMDHHK